MDTNSPTSRLILITGGARSGKSTFAERLAKESGRSVAYIATALASDADMQQRIERHRASRPASWHTLEESLNLSQAIEQAAELADVVLLDCITTWLGNWLLEQGEIDFDASEAGNVLLYEHVLIEVREVLTTIAALPAQKTIVVVTNEVGMGIVPAYALGRVYRDLLGVVNQFLAAEAERVYLLIAGLAVDIKRLHEQARL